MLVRTKAPVLFLNLYLASTQQILKDTGRCMEPLPANGSSYKLAKEVVNYSRTEELMLALTGGLYKP